MWDIGKYGKYRSNYVGAIEMVFHVKRYIQLFKSEIGLEQIPNMTR
jgi:hypothetical protein